MSSLAVQLQDRWKPFNKMNDLYLGVHKQDKNAFFLRSVHPFAQLADGEEPNDNDDDNNDDRGGSILSTTLHNTSLQASSSNIPSDTASTAPMLPERLANARSRADTMNINHPANVVGIRPPSPSFIDIEDNLLTNLAQSGTPSTTLVISNAPSKHKANNNDTYLSTSHMPSPSSTHTAFVASEGQWEVAQQQEKREEGKKEVSSISIYMLFVEFILEEAWSVW